MCNKMPQNPPETLYEVEPSVKTALNNFAVLTCLDQVEQEKRLININLELEWTIPATECDGIQDTYDVVLLLAQLRSVGSWCDFPNALLGVKPINGKNKMALQLDCDDANTPACNKCQNRVIFMDDTIEYCPFCKHKLSEAVMLSALQEVKELYPEVICHDITEGSE